MSKSAFISVSPVPCMHIHAYYNEMQQQHPCIAHNLLRKGYKQWACGVVELPVNNLFGDFEND